MTGLKTPVAVPAISDNDCLRFVDRVRGLARESSDLGTFLDKLAKTFIGIDSSTADEMRDKANRSVGERFTSSGWFPSYYDEPSDNQARHFVGGLIAGFRLGGPAGHLVMNRNEDSQADLRVNLVSIGLGERLGNRDSDAIFNADTGQETTLAKFDFRKLAGKIEDAVCVREK